MPSGIPLFSAVIQSLQAGYSRNALRGDLLAGVTVGIIAIPLAMALAIAVGVPPQHGLYTVLIAAPLIALCGGSRFNISGPTAAFIVILLPITQQHGLGGLLLCTLLAGLILLAMGLLRLGRLISFVPYPVTLGFTASTCLSSAAHDRRHLPRLPADRHGDWHSHRLLAAPQRHCADVAPRSVRRAVPGAG